MDTTNHRRNVLGYTYLGETLGRDFEQTGALVARNVDRVEAAG